jgi:hypothetical protein
VSTLDESAAALLALQLEQDEDLAWALQSDHYLIGVARRRGRVRAECYCGQPTSYVESEARAIYDQLKHEHYWRMHKAAL